MKRATSALLAAFLLPAAAGCLTPHGHLCHSGHCGTSRGHGPLAAPAVTAPAGPPSATVTYPYYTTRGPRDFLIDEPATVGP